MQRKLLYLFFGIVSISVNAQRLRGKVVDSKTNEFLAFANIVFNNDPHLQISSDISGSFSFESTATIRSLSCSYVGYRKTDIEISTTVGNTILVMMVPADNILDEITIVAGENPAYRIIKSAISNKRFNNPENIGSFQYQCYNKISADLKWNGTQKVDTVLWNNFVKGKHLLLMESVTERKFLSPDYSEETVVATKVSGFQNLPFAALATDLQPFAFYEDYIKLLNIRYLNPISKGSLKKYDFRLEETILKEKDTVFLISFKPKKHKNFDGLKGVLYINSNRYAIQNVIASAYEKSSIILKVQQQYQWTNNQYWFPEQINYLLTTKGLSKFKDVSTTIEGKSFISNVAFDVLMLRKDFAMEAVHMAKDANTKDSLFWSNARNKSLNPKELKTYTFIDSIGKKNNFDGKLNVVRKLAENKVAVSFVDIDLSKTLKFNDFEGLRVGTGVHTNEKFSKDFTIGGFLGYGQKDEQWKYGLESYYDISGKKEFTFGFRYQQNLMEIGGYGMRQYQHNFINFRDYMANQFDGIKQNSILINFRTFKYLQCQVALNQTDIMPVSPSDLKHTDPTRQIFKNTDATVYFRFAYKEKIVQIFDTNYSLGAPYPIFYGYLSKGLKSISNGTLDYLKLEIAVEQTFFTKNLGKTSYRFEAGHIDCDLPNGLLFTGEGSYSRHYPYASKNTFQSMKPYEFISDQYVNVFLAHNFGTLLFKTRISQPGISIHHNLSWGALKQNQVFDKTFFNTKEKIFSEAGLQLDNIIKLNFRNLGYIGIGSAAFCRYGYYSVPDFNDNIAYKITFNFTLK